MGYMQVESGHTVKLEKLSSEPAHGTHPSGCSSRHVVLIRAEKTPEDAYKKVLISASLYALVCQSTSSCF